jgi:hypothetical protein
MIPEGYASPEDVMSALRQSVDRENERPSLQLAAWWDETADDDLKAVMPKVDEYTALDLEIMGDVLERWGIAAKGGGQEAACMWYLLGKVARAVAAYREGREPSEDTLHDITVYSMMARRIREVGRWPS